MKKFVFILAVTFAIALFVSSCNNQVCPAYSKAETDQTDYNG